MSRDDIKKYINSDRRDFKHEGIRLHDLSENPIHQFEAWMEEAIGAQVRDPYATCLSTIDQEGRPKSRMVYLRDLIEDEFVIYTNYLSDKGREIEAGGYAALNFHWSLQDRQVRVEGEIARVSAEVSDHYFMQRPRESQLGAWASHQSTKLDDRQVLIDRLEEVKSRFEGREVTRPPHWGGYGLKPSRMEFFQGRTSRLHDRFRYDRQGDGWMISRLSP